MPRTKKKNRRFERRRVLHVKLRSSQRRQKWVRRMAILVILVVGVGGGMYGGWQGIQQLWLELVERNPFFALERLDIRTDGAIAPGQIERWAGVQAGQNLFSLRLNRIKRDLELVPAIRSASVERVLPETLRIRVGERLPIARLVYPAAPSSAAGRTILLDEEGFAMLPLGAHELTPHSPRRYEQLPFLSGVPPDRIRTGRPIISGQVDAALDLIGAFEASPMAKVTRVVSVDVRIPGVLRLETDEGCEVQFGLTGFERQLRRWEAVREEARQVGREVSWLDLSVSNNVPVRWRHQPG